MPPVSAFPTHPREGLPPTITEVQKQTLLDYLTAFGLASQLTQAEKLQFVEIAQAFHLNPFKREIHVAVFGEGEYRRLSIITGYEVYLKRAERTNKLDGWKAWIEGEGATMKAFVEIHRKDWSEPFVHEVYWAEAVQKKKDGSPTSFWTKQPRFQLKKVAISQAFRLAFPDELGGLPYDAAELPDAETISAMAPMPATEPSPSVQAATPIRTLIRQVDVPQAIPVQPEPCSIPPAASSAVSERAFVPSDRFPDESVATLLGRLESYLEDNYEAFTEKHTDWIFEKAKKSNDREGVLKMLGYAEKVVRNGAVAGVSA